MSSAQLPVHREDDIVLREIIFMLSKNKWKVILTTVVFLVLGMLYVLFATSEYKAQAVVQVDRQNLPVPGVAVAGMDAAVPGTRGVTEVQLLASRSVVGAAVDKLGLVEQMLGAAAGGSSAERDGARLMVIERIRANLNAVEQGRDSGVIQVEYTDSKQDRALNVLQEVINAYLARNMERNSAEAEKSMRFVQAQLPKVRSELEKAQEALNAYQNQHQAVDIPMQTNSLLARSNTIDASLQQLRFQQADLTRRYTGRHPAFQSLLRQISDLEREEATIRARLAALPDIQRGLLQLQRDVDVTSQTYSNLLDQAQKFDIARASAIGTARMVDVPKVNPNPVWPKPVLIIAGAALLGALLSIAWLIFRYIVLVD